MAASFGDQLAFARYFAGYSHMNGNVILAWCLQEQPPGQPAAGHGNNWLNVEGPPGDKAAIIAANAQDGALKTVEWTERNQPHILASAGQGPYAESLAIVQSGWAASHYYGIANFYAVVQRVTREEGGRAPALPRTGASGVTGHVNAPGRVPVRVSTSGNPPDHSHKVYASGKKLGVRGSGIAGHTRQVQELRRRHTILPRLRK